MPPIELTEVINICDRCHERIDGEVFIQHSAILCRQCAKPVTLPVPIAVHDAQLKLAIATNRLLRAEEAVEIGLLLGKQDRDLRSLRAAVARLVEARARSNQVDFWRAIGDLEAYTHIGEVNEL